MAFDKIESDSVLSSWKDSYISSDVKKSISFRAQVPAYGCYKDVRESNFDNKAAVVSRIWKIRGYLDKLVGGIGLSRGRTNSVDINVGDALDFWRVIYSNKKSGRLILFAEMKLPGEVWLEFKISEKRLVLIATFRPKGIWGRLYWWSVYPLHGIIFREMLQNLAYGKT